MAEKVETELIFPVGPSRTSTSCSPRPYPPQRLSDLTPSMLHSADFVNAVGTAVGCCSLQISILLGRLVISSDGVISVCSCARPSGLHANCDLVLSSVARAVVRGAFNKCVA